MTLPAKVGAVLLAAGASHRFGQANKLLAEFDGRPLVLRSAERLLNAGLGRVVAVLGDEAPRLREVLQEVAGLDLVDNPNHGAGMGTSIAAGVRHLQQDDELDAAMIALGDMPYLRTETVAALAAAFDPEAGAEIVVPVCDSERGHPVLFARRFFDALGSLTGDVGAKHVVRNEEEVVAEVETDDPGILRDVDTPEDMAEEGG